MLDKHDDSNVYAPSARSKIKRAHERGSYDYDSVHKALDCGLLCHIGYVIDGQPYVTPTTYCREGKRLFWHGSSASKMLRSMHAGVNVCFTVTHFHGLVMARSKFHHSANYASVMAFGKAQLIEDTQEKNRILDLITDHIVAGRRKTLRDNLPIELKATSVVFMDIEDAALKVRNGPPVDDEEDYDKDCWAGVVPIETRFVNPVDDPRLKPNIEVPEHIKKMVGQKIGEMSG